MKPADYPLRFYRFDTPSDEWRLVGDFTGHIPKLQIRDGANGPLLADLSSSIIPALEPAVGSVPAKTLFTFRGLEALEVTAILAAVNPRYDFQLTAGTIKRTYLRGPVCVELDVSE
jgi:hypothetical protein